MTTSRLDWKSEYRMLRESLYDLRAIAQIELLKERVEVIARRFPPTEELDEDGYIDGWTRIADDSRKMHQVIAFDLSGQRKITGRLAAGSGYTFHTEPMRKIFKPLGMLLWNTTEDTRIMSLKIGNQEQLITKGLPGRMFETGKSFSELKELAANNQLAWPGEEHTIFECKAAEPGQNITIEFTGPLTDIALWGLTVAD